MTKYLLFSDIQGDSEALEELLRASKDIPRDAIICLGDLLAKGKKEEENKLLNMLRGFGCKLSCVRGNHEDNYINNVRSTNSDALTKENRDFISQLPLMLNKNGEVFAYHSSLTHPNDPLLRGFLNWEYASVKREACNAEFALFGHSHVPQVLSYNPRTEESAIAGESGTIDLGGDFYFINPGSIAEPGICCDRKTFATIDTKIRQARFYELD